MIDEIDATILNILQTNARTSNADIARQLGMAPSAIFERVRKLEARGTLSGYEARIEPHAVGAGLLAFIFVRAHERVGSLYTGSLLADIPGVQEVHEIAGEDCYLVKVRVADTDALGKLLRERVGSLDTVSSTRTTIVLQTVKESAQLPIPQVTLDAVLAEAIHD